MRKMAERSSAKSAAAGRCIPQMPGRWNTPGRLAYMVVPAASFQTPLGCRQIGFPKVVS